MGAMSGGGGGAGAAPNMPPGQLPPAQNMPLPGAVGPAPVMPQGQMPQAQTMPMAGGAMAAPDISGLPNSTRTGAATMPLQNPTLHKGTLAKIAPYLQGANAGAAPLQNSLATRPGSKQAPFALPPMTMIAPPSQQSGPGATGAGYTLARDARGNVTGLTTASMGDIGGENPASRRGGAFFGR